MDTMFNQKTVSLLALVADGDIRVLPDTLKEFDTDLRESHRIDGVESEAMAHQRHEALLGALCSTIGWYSLDHLDAFLSSVDSVEDRNAIEDAITFVFDRFDE